MRILIISDAAPPQVNGVVTTIMATISELEAQGDNVLFVTPSDFPSRPMPGYSEISLVKSTRGLADMMTAFNPDFIHIATEGPLGWAARAICLRKQWRFTTAYHTDFPRFLKHFFVPAALTFAALRKFHSPSCAVMVSTPTIENELLSKGFKKIVRWGRGVDQSIFSPQRASHNPEPVFLSVGRISKEKNLEAFFDLDLPGRKVVVGDGPMLDTYRSNYPAVEFVGTKRGVALGDIYRSADCFVFPSKSDTFGLVMAEAISCGTPVAAYPVQGPVDVVVPGSGVLNNDLRKACLDALELDRNTVADLGQSFTWTAATAQFRGALVPK